MNTLATLEKDPRAAIVTLLDNDPQLKSKHTTRQYKADLFAFETWRAGRAISKSLVEEYAAKLQHEGKAPNTINQRLAAIRWYARKIADLAIDYGESDLADFYAKQTARIASVKDVKGQRPERGRHIEQGELSALMTVCMNDPSPAGARDAAIIALAWATGLRRDEISGIQLADLTNQTGDSLDIVITAGKGDKARVVYVNDGALSAILDWLDIRGREPGALFVSVNKGGRLTGGKLSGEALRKMLDKRSGQAELSQAITWHDFRRSFAGNLWGAGIDGVTIQKLMGHASQNQTARYDRRPEDARRQAVKVLHVPYKRK